MKDGKFEVGDIVVGLKNNKYNITNEDMQRGEVISDYANDDMRVKVLAHVNECEVNEEYDVENSTTQFALIRSAGAENNNEELAYLIDKLTAVRNEVSATKIDPPTQAMTRNHIDGAISYLRRLQK